METQSNTALARHSGRIIQSLSGIDPTYRIRDYIANNLEEEPIAPIGIPAQRAAVRIRLFQQLHETAPARYPDPPELLLDTILTGDGDQQQNRELTQLAASIMDDLTDEQKAEATQLFVTTVVSEQGHAELLHLLQFIPVFRDTMEKQHRVVLQDRILLEINAAASPRGLLPLTTVLARLGDSMDSIIDEPAKTPLLDALLISKDRTRTSQLILSVLELGGRPTPKQVDKAADRIIRAISKAAVSWDSMRLGRELQSLAANVTPAQAEALGQKLIDSIGDSIFSTQVRDIGEEIRDLGAEARAARIDRHAKILEGWNRNHLGYALRELTKRHPDQMQLFIPKLLPTPTAQIDIGNLRALNWILASLPEESKVPDPRGLTDQLLDMIPRISDSKITLALASLLRSLEGDLSPNQARLFGDHLLERIHFSYQFEDVSDLAATLFFVKEALADSQFNQAVDLLIERCSSSKNPWEIGWLGGWLALLEDRLGVQRANAIARTLVDAMLATNDWFEISQLAETLGELSTHLGTDASASLANRLIDAMADAPDSRSLGALAVALAALKEQLPPTLLRSASTLLLTAIEAQENASNLDEVASALGSIAGTLSETETLSVTSRFIDLLNQASDDERSNLGAALQRLVENSRLDFAGLQMRQVVDAIETTTDYQVTWKLRDTLYPLAKRVPSATAAPISLELLDARLRTRNAPNGGAFTKALELLSNRLPEPDALTLASKMLDILVTTDEASLFQDLSSVLSTINIPRNIDAADTAIDLLQAPMAFGETREHLLRYYSRVAGLPEDAGFLTTDDFVAWAREHRPDLNLNRRPRMPATLAR